MIDRKLTIERLRALGACEVGDPFPVWMTTTPSNNWGETLAALCRDAADLIECDNYGRGGGGGGSNC